MFACREDLWIRDGVIQNPLLLFFEEKRKPDIMVDCNNLIVAPGYIDIHLNGNACLYLYDTTVTRPSLNLKIISLTLADNRVISCFFFKSGYFAISALKLVIFNHRQSFISASSTQVLTSLAGFQNSFKFCFQLNIERIYEKNIYTPFLTGGFFHKRLTLVGLDTRFIVSRVCLKTHFSCIFWSNTVLALDISVGTMLLKSLNGLFMLFRRFQCWLFFKCCWTRKRFGKSWSKNLEIWSHIILSNNCYVSRSYLSWGSIYDKNLYLC